MAHTRRVSYYLSSSLLHSRLLLTPQHPEPFLRVEADGESSSLLLTNHFFRLANLYLDFRLALPAQLSPYKINPYKITLTFTNTMT